VEHLIVTKQGVSVSYSQLVTKDKIYAIKDILFAECRSLAPKRSLARVSTFGGLAMLFGSGILPFIGLIAILTGMLLWHAAKLSYAIVLHTSTGEIRALISKDYFETLSVVDALNEVTAMRGMKPKSASGDY
jgi:hypothetical protein